MYSDPDSNSIPAPESIRLFNPAIRAQIDRFRARTRFTFALRAQMGLV